MTKTQIAQTINGEIEYRNALIKQAQSGILLHLSTPEKVQAYVDEQEQAIFECRWIASKLHVKLD